jgi:hypothetical protein
MEGRTQVAKRVLIKRSFVRSRPGVQQQLTKQASEASVMHTFDMIRILIRRAEEADKLRYQGETYDVQGVCDRAHDQCSNYGTA